MKDAYSDGSLVDEVMQLMLKALAHSGGKDPDVLEVLGVLYVVFEYSNNFTFSCFNGITQITIERFHFF